jgi:hypothetical protein
MAKDEILARDILNSLKSDLAPKDIAEIDEYAAHKEWGLVGRVLLSIAYEKNITVRPELVQTALNRWSRYELNDLADKFASVWLNPKVLVAA